MRVGVTRWEKLGPMWGTAQRTLQRETEHLNSSNQGLTRAEQVSKTELTAMASNSNISHVAAGAKTQADEAQAHTQQNPSNRASQVHIHPQFAHVKAPNPFSHRNEGDHLS